jgi:rare lipoprotein A
VNVRLQALFLAMIFIHPKPCSLDYSFLKVAPAAALQTTNLGGALASERFRAADEEVLARIGIASWYSESDPFINRHTASGEVFEDSELTCASWDYAFGTHLKVTNLTSGKSVVCRVNDRGPSRRLNRLIDLSKTTFRAIAPLRRGLVRVSIAPVASPVS